MIRIVCVGFIVVLIGLAAYAGVTLYDETLQVGRMWETPAVRPHEAPLPVMAATTVPASGGELLYRSADPDTLAAPFDLADPQAVAQGQQGYRFYCIQCHGVDMDGYGTVGQSFAPPPGDLRSARVQNLPVGRVFHEISYGIPGGRQPALASTIAVDERWQIIAFVKSVGARP
ncbi:MAG: c-type cytochrome [Desulfatitalea sp.]|nr:c-type cytochrome [Desulfatitalea sp.]